MNWYNDWRFWGLLILLLSSVITQIGGIIMSMSVKKSNNKIMNNDLKHLALDVKELNETVSEGFQETRETINKVWTSIEIIGKKQAARDAVCNERHKK